MSPSGYGIHWPLLDEDKCMMVSKRSTVVDLNSNKASLLDVYEDYVTEYVLTETKFVAAKQAIYHDAKHPSHILLPMIPEK